MIGTSVKCVEWLRMEHLKIGTRLKTRARAFFRFYHFVHSSIRTYQ